MPRYNNAVRECRRRPAWVSSPTKGQGNATEVLLPNGERSHAPGKATSFDYCYSDAETEFILAMGDLKRRLGRMPVAWEVLREAKALGYALPDRPGLKIFEG